MAQLFALVWLKWTLFRNSMRSRKAVAGRVASALGMLAALALALLVAASLGAAAYFLTLEARGGGGQASALREAFAILFFILTTVFMMWALMPLALGGGSRFEPGRMLLYPVSLRKLFFLDLLSDLTSLTSVFAVPVVCAMGLGAGLAAGNVPAGLMVGLCAVAFGMAVSKLLSVGVGALMRSGRTRGETVLALLGAVLGMTGAMMGQLMPMMDRFAPYLGYARWTPPGATASALTYGLAPGGAGVYAASLATLAAYACASVFFAYRVARRTALGVGGGTKRGKARGRERAFEQYAGWQLPFVSPQVSAVVEKELRYAARNAQLRVIVLMAVGLTIVLRMAPAGAGSRRGLGDLTPFAEGAGTVFSVLYIFMLVSPLSTNLFGYEGAGMRALVLSPIARRKLLLGKNVAVTLISLALAVAGVLAGGLIFRDLTPQTLLFAALTFVSTAALFAVFGNWMSLQFPKRVEFGKRMNRSGVAGFLLAPFFALLLAPPAVAVAAAHFAQSLAVKYVILAAFAVLSSLLYLSLLPLQASALERRELEILEAVTGRDGEGGGIIG